MARLLAWRSLSSFATTMSGKAQPGSYINAKHICYIYPLKSHESTVIFLHGLGDAGSGWYEPMQLLQDCLPNTKFVLPTAPRQPVSINNGMVMASWFDIVGLSDRANEKLEGIESARSAVVELIDLEVQSARIPPTKIVLGGFSQGGAVALYTALQLPFSLAGLCALSTYLPYGVEMSTRISEAAKKTPALLLHGLNDEVVGCGYSERTRDVLVSAGLQPQHKTYPYIGHSMDDRMLSDLAKFLKTVL